MAEHSRSQDGWSEGGVWIRMASGGGAGGDPVKIQPDSAKFGEPQGGFNFSHHKITLGPGVKEKMGLKVKCSDNRMYRLRPVYAWLEPGKETQLSIARLQGPDKMDKIVIHVAKPGPGAPAEPGPFWKARKEPPDFRLSFPLCLNPKTAAAAEDQSSHTAPAA